MTDQMTWPDAADVVESLCDWRANYAGARDHEPDHRTFHLGHQCPYEAMAAVLRGKPDPRREKAIDQMTWDGSIHCADYDDDLPCGVGELHCANAITDWVHDLGGEAWYVNEGEWGQRIDPHIEITGPDPREPLIVKPGDTVIDTGEWFEVIVYEGHVPALNITKSCRLFRVAAAGTGSER